MSVKIRFLGPLKQYQPLLDGSDVWVADVEGKTIADVVSQSPLSESGWDFMQLVNGQSVDREYILANGDSLDIMPTLVGG